MKRVIGTALLAVGCFALGAVWQRWYTARQAPTAAAAGMPELPSAPPESPAAPIRFDHEPLWAYGFERPPLRGEKAGPQAPPSRALRPGEDPGEQTTPLHIQGSTAAYTLVDIRDGQNVVDWFPHDHPPMPDVVEHGPERLGRARRGCASCHLPTGKGRPENAAPAGLPLPYFLRQIDDFRRGLRHSADPRKPNTNTMIDLARAMTDAEIMDAARYFTSMKWTPWIRVVETTLVPKTRISGNLFLPLGPELTEPIGNRIVEMPEDEAQAETYRNPHSGFVAYVPVGSLRRGEDLVVRGGNTVVNDRIVQGPTTPCATCHGPDLMGVADVPPIAGRSPSYIARQLWDIQQGTRNGASAQLMKLVVANLTENDMLAIAAYVASRPIPPAPATRMAAVTR